MQNESPLEVDGTSAAKPLYGSREEAYAAYRSAPNRYFERYHERHFDERELISPEWKWFETKYHYNLVENGIVDILRDNQSRVTACRVLDVGCGTGHWLEFYRRYMEAERIVGIDFSEVAAAELAGRYSEDASIEVVRGDISEFNPAWAGQFDVINAIGVMFHIVDDGKWSRAVAHLSRYLSPRGIAIIGGDFGDCTEDLGVMRRVRSLQRWETLLEEIDCRVCGLKRFDWFKGGVNEGLKDNLLAFRRA